jgi:hypothetical protein
MSNRGAYKYIPADMLEEVTKVKEQFNIDRDADAFRKITDLSAMSRELRFVLGPGLQRRNKK